MKDIKIDQGAIEELLIEDTEAVSVSILVSLNAETAPIIEKPATFVDGKAQISLLNSDTDIATGDYVYQIRLFDENGEFFNLTNSDCTSGDCTLGTFTICPSIPEITVSA